jgi:hypothetical protein
VFVLGLGTLKVETQGSFLCNMKTPPVTTINAKKLFWHQSKPQSIGRALVIDRFVWRKSIIDRWYEKLLI